MKVRLALGNGKSCGRVFGNPLPHGFHEIEQAIGRLLKDRYIVRNLATAPERCLSVEVVGYKPVGRKQGYIQQDPGDGKSGWKPYALFVRREMCHRMNRLPRIFRDRVPIDANLLKWRL